MLIKLGQSYVNPLHIQFIRVSENNNERLSADIEFREKERMCFIMSSEELDEIVSKVNDHFIRVFAELLR